MSLCNLIHHEGCVMRDNTLFIITRFRSCLMGNVALSRLNMPRYHSCTLKCDRKLASPSSDRSTLRFCSSYGLTRRHSNLHTRPQESAHDNQHKTNTKPRLVDLRWKPGLAKNTNRTNGNIVTTHGTTVVNYHAETVRNAYTRAAFRHRS